MESNINTLGRKETERHGDREEREEERKRRAPGTSVIWLVSSVERERVNNEREKQTRFRVSEGESKQREGD